MYSPPAVTGNISLWKAVSPRSRGNHQNNGSKPFHCLLPNQISVLYWDPRLTILLKKIRYQTMGTPFYTQYSSCHILLSPLFINPSHTFLFTLNHDLTLCETTERAPQPQPTLRRNPDGRDLCTINPPCPSILYSDRSLKIVPFHLVP